MKRKFTAALTALLAISMIGCGTGGKEAATGTDTGDSKAGKTAAAEADAGNGADKNTLVVGINSTLDTLDPWSPQKPSKFFVCSVLYQSLGQAAEIGSSQLEGVLMKEWTQIDTMTYDIELYDSIVDTAGNPFTSSDVAFCFEKYAETNTTYVDNIEITGDYTFTMHLNSEAPGSFERMCEYVYMVTEEAYNASGDGMAVKAVGTSPYQVREFTEGAKIVLEKADSYWQTDDLNIDDYKANVDVIEYDVLTEVTQLALAVETGTVDIAMQVEDSALGQLEGIENLAITFTPDICSRGIMFNMTESSPFYDNLALRQAVCYAIDKESVALACTYGYGSPSAAAYGTASQVGYNSEWENNTYSYDVEKAKELLAEAGYKEGELNIRLLSNQNAAVKSMWEVIQANLAEIGINAEIILADGSSYGAWRDATSGQYDIAYCGQDYGNYVTITWDTLYNADLRESGLTWFGLDDPKVQEQIHLLETADGFTQENIDAFYDYTTKNCYYYQIFNMDNAIVYNTDRVSGVEEAVNFNGYVQVNAVTLTK
ncbi:MAG: ABC transporter substrate-binding protein [Clostridiales bacterium]|nr:ABC transporter substrate-binding protein [Clostridiales bacterium]